ncbi:MAG: hypothetical protein JXR51_08095 [Bacteroidales bacterium]|nr:hypothetical protein [Bacteroidales bacterium]
MKFLILYILSVFYYTTTHGQINNIKEKFDFEYNNDLKKKYYFHKEFGKIINIERTGLSAIIGEKGFIYFYSSYVGKKWLNHTGIQLLINDIVYSINVKKESILKLQKRDLKIEIIAFPSDNNMVRIIAAYSGEVKVRFLSENNVFEYKLSSLEKEGLKDCYLLSQFLKNL